MLLLQSIPLYLAMLSYAEYTNCVWTFVHQCQEEKECLQMFGQLVILFMCNDKQMNINSVCITFSMHIQGLEINKREKKHTNKYMHLHIYNY